jgi:hypothetical protein
MRTLTLWLLGGALLASLTWNLKLVRERQAPVVPAAHAALEGCDLSSMCSADDPERCAKLADLCARACGESDRLEDRAAALQVELLSVLSAAEVDTAEAERLVDAIALSRRQALAACVTGVLDVRDVVPREQVRVLLERCKTEAEDCR